MEPKVNSWQVVGDQMGLGGTVEVSSTKKFEQFQQSESPDGQQPKAESRRSPKGSSRNPRRN